MTEYWTYVFIGGCMQCMMLYNDDLISIYLPEPNQSLPVNISENPFGIFANNAFLLRDSSCT